MWDMDMSGLAIGLTVVAAAEPELVAEETEEALEA